MRRYLHYFDKVMMHYIALLPTGARPTMRFASLIGHPLITVGTILGVLVYAVLMLEWQLMVIAIIALVTFITSSVMKIWLHRARPASDYVRSMWLQTFSFPSGHAAGSLVSFGMVAYLTCEMWPQYAFWVVVLLGVVCFMVGVSRVSLGAHYPSDVIGGWVVGGAGLLLIVTIGVAS